MGILEQLKNNNILQNLKQNAPTVKTHKKTPAAKIKHLKLTTGAQGSQHTSKATIEAKMEPQGKHNHSFFLIMNTRKIIKNTTLQKTEYCYEECAIRGGMPNELQNSQKRLPPI